MITEFEDFCTWVFVVVDDIWEQIAPFFKRPGPAPVCSDSELIAMALIGECRDEKADYFWLSLASSDHSGWSDPRL